jgi:hypothetical protein
MKAVLAILALVGSTLAGGGGGGGDKGVTTTEVTYETTTVCPITTTYTQGGQ